MKCEVSVGKEWYFKRQNKKRQN